MKKTGEEEETKIKSNIDNKSSYIFEVNKYQNFVEDIVIKILNKTEKAKDFNTPEYLETSIKNSIFQHVIMHFFYIRIYLH